MTDYMILIPGTESTWADASEEEKAATYQRHGRFAELLAERGHRITAGAELMPSPTARTVRVEGGSISVTEGPYAETVEQLTGFYLVESDDLDDLLEVVGFLAGAEGTVEVRACVDHSAGA